MPTDNIYAQVKRSVEWLFDTARRAKHDYSIDIANMSKVSRIDYACANIPGATREMVERAVDEIEAEARK